MHPFLSMACEGHCQFLEVVGGEGSITAVCNCLVLNFSEGVTAVVGVRGPPPATIKAKQAVDIGVGAWKKKPLSITLHGSQAKEEIDDRICDTAV